MKLLMYLLVIFTLAAIGIDSVSDSTEANTQRMQALNQAWLSK